MTTYDQFITRDEYQSKYAGAALGVRIFNEDLPSELLIGRVTGVNPNENFETIPVEEAGNDGVDEFIQGRHDGAMSLGAFWTPQWNDTVPTRQNFIGKKYTVLIYIAPTRPSEAVVIDAYVGCVLNNVSGPFGARGPRTFSLAFMFERRYNGLEWSQVGTFGLGGLVAVNG